MSLSPDRPPSFLEKRLASWLLVSLILVFGMVVLGGLTRLTGSGLSMVGWKPLTGFIPPLTLQDWEALFRDYQTSPQFLKVNPTMTLEAFKDIFWLEFLHRVWGRVLGLVFLGPLFLCLIHPSLRSLYGIRMGGIWILGGLQGVMGWYMVKSGLVDVPEVSPYRLASHLLLAFATFSLIFWTYLDLTRKPLALGCDAGRLLPPSFLLLSLGLVCATMFYGALVAGLKAGLLYNTFPTMDGAWVPDEVGDPSLGWRRFFEEPGVVQWVHRLLAFSTVLSVIFLRGYHHRLPQPLQRSLTGMLVVVLAQMALGIITLLMQVPVSLGVLHQGGALIVLASLLRLLHFSKNTFCRQNSEVSQTQSRGQKRTGEEKL